jgi:hypothetical protein
MKIFACLMILTLWGCDKKNIDTDLSSKSEYSILQSFEYEYSDFGHDENFILVHNALGTGHNILAFPISQAEKGYVVMLTDADSKPKDKRIPEKGFTVNMDVLNKVKKLTNLSTEVELLIIKQIDKYPEKPID